MPASPRNSSTPSWHPYPISPSWISRLGQNNQGQGTAAKYAENSRLTQKGITPNAAFAASDQALHLNAYRRKRAWIGSENVKVAEAKQSLAYDGFRGVFLHAAALRLPTPEPERQTALVAPFGSASKSNID